MLNLALVALNGRTGRLKSRRAYQEKVDECVRGERSMSRLV